MRITYSWSFGYEYSSEAISHTETGKQTHATHELQSTNITDLPISGQYHTLDLYSLSQT